MNGLQTRRSAQFDGLRTYAILMIICSHTGAFKLTVGGAMVALFLALSGFFAVRPYDTGDFEAKYLKPVNWLKYWFLRICRIMPVFWAVSVFMWSLGLFKGKLTTVRALLENMFLLNANGHLWYVQNQMAIYLFVPLLLLLSLGIRKLIRLKGRTADLADGLILIALGIGAEYLFRHVIPFVMTGNGAKQYLRLGIFIIGMGYGMIAKACSGIRITGKGVKAVLDLLILFLLVAGGLTAPAWLVELGITAKKVNVGWVYPQWCAAAWGILFLLLYVNGEGLMAKLLSVKWIRTVGEASFCMYLVQSFLIRATKQMPTVPLKWLLVCVLSAGVAVMSYQLFEKPLYDRLRRLTERRGKPAAE